MPYKLASLLLNSEQRSSSIAKIAWAEADRSDPDNETRFLRVGKIFSLVEVYATNNKAMLLLDFFSERPKLNYYQQPGLNKNEYPDLIDLEKFFTAAIQQTNNELNDFLAEHKINYYYPEVSATIGLLTEKGLFLSSIGSNQAWIFAPDQPIDQQVNKIIVPNNHNQERSPRLFQDIFSGSLANYNYCLISNEALAEYIDPKTALNLMADRSPLVGVEKLKNFLQQTNRRVDFLGLVIQRCRFTDLETDSRCPQDPASFLKKNQTIYQTQLIANNLRITEEQTEKILNPSLGSKVVNLFKRGILGLGRSVNRLTRHDWINSGRQLVLKIKQSYQKVRAWLIWQWFKKLGQQVKLITTNAWYKLRPHLKKAGSFLFTYWDKATPWRHRLLEKYQPKWQKIKEKLTPKQSVSSLSKKRYTSKQRWQKLSKRSRWLLLLTIIFIILLAGGLIWQRQLQVNQANLQSQIEQIELIEQKHNQIEANLLYKNFDSANQALDEVEDLLTQQSEHQNKLSNKIIERWQEAQLRQESLIGQVRQIYSLRNLRYLEGQNDNLLPTENSQIIANGSLLAWTDPSNQQVVYQDQDSLWQTTSWPDGWTNLIVGAVYQDKWFFTNDTGQLASLDTAGQWIEWSFDQPVEEIKALDFFGDRFYVIAEDNQIYRYQQQENKFINKTLWNTDKLPQGSIAGLIVDGQVYVFYQDSQVFKFSNGRQQNFELDLLDPLVEHWSNCHLTESDKFSCWDQLGQRLINYQLNGSLLSQYQFKDQPTIYQAVVNYLNLAIYNLTNNGVYLSTPPLSKND